MTSSEQSDEQPATEPTPNDSELPTAAALVDHVEESLPQPDELVDRYEFTRRDDDVVHG